MSALAMTDDHELLAAWRAGDTDAGDALFERWFDRLYRFFWNKVDEGAEDLVQQTLLACVEGKEVFRGDAPFASYVIGVARRRLYRHWEQRSRGRAGIDFEAVSIADLGASPTGALARRTDERQLLSALRRICLDDQIVLELHYWEELGGPELARLLGLPEGTVRSQLRRAKAALRDALARVEGEAQETTEDGLEAWARRVRDAAFAGRRR
jgi:RNA polymerase sigma-70 factor (ECF subfamily)